MAGYLAATASTHVADGYLERPERSPMRLQRVWTTALVSFTEPGSSVFSALSLCHRLWRATHSRMRHCTPSSWAWEAASSRLMQSWTGTSSRCLASCAAPVRSWKWLSDGYGLVIVADGSSDFRSALGPAGPALRRLRLPVGGGCLLGLRFLLLNAGGRQHVLALCRSVT